MTQRLVCTIVDHIGCYSKTAKTTPNVQCQGNWAGHGQLQKILGLLHRCGRIAILTFYYNPSAIQPNIFHVFQIIRWILSSTDCTFQVIYSSQSLLPTFSENGHPTAELWCFKCIVFKFLSLNSGIAPLLSILYRNIVLI